MTRQINFKASELDFFENIFWFCAYKGARALVRLDLRFAFVSPTLYNF